MLPEHNAHLTGSNGYSFAIARKGSFFILETACVFVKSSLLCGSSIDTLYTEVERTFSLGFQYLFLNRADSLVTRCCIHYV